MKKLKYVYHISFGYSQNNIWGLGHTTLYRTNKIDSEDDIVSITDYIEKRYNCDNVVIINVILLNKKGK